MTTIKETLIELFEIDKMEPAKAAETLDRLGKLVFQATLLRALPLLPDKDMDAYEKVLEENQADGLFKFLIEKIPNFNAMLDEEARALHDELAGEFEEAGL